MGGAACKLYYRHRFKPPGLLQKAPLLLCLSHTRQLSVDVPFAWCISGDLPGWRRKTQLQSECGSFWWHLVAGIIRLACYKRIKRMNSQDPSRISTWTMMDYFQQCWIYVYIFDDSSDEPFFSSEYWIQYLLEERWIWNEMNEWHAASAFHVAVSALASLAAAIIFDSRPAVTWDGHVSEPLELQNESTWLDLLLHFEEKRHV